MPIIYVASLARARGMADAHWTISVETALPSVQPASTRRTSRVWESDEMNDMSSRLWAGEQNPRTGARSLAKMWIGLGIVIGALGVAWLAYSYGQTGDAAHADRPLFRRS
jgi:hypothetical protein